MNAQWHDLDRRRWFADPRSARVVEIAMYELPNAVSPAELLRSVARLTGIGECRLRRSWGTDQALQTAAIRYALTLALG